jgi:hypothetical protein
MKTPRKTEVALIGLSLLFLGLWAGYSLGYHHGMKDEQRKWESTVQIDSQGREVFFRQQAKAQFEAVFTVQNPIPEKFSK